MKAVTRMLAHKSAEWLVHMFFVYFLQAREGWDILGVTPEMFLCLGILLVYFVEQLARFWVCHDMHSPVGRHGKLIRVTKKRNGTWDGGSGIGIFIFCVAETGEDNHGVQVYNKEPPNQSDEAAAVYFRAMYFREHGRTQPQHNGDSGEQQTNPLSSSPQSEPINVSARVSAHFFDTIALY